MNEAPERFELRCSREELLEWRKAALRQGSSSLSYWLRTIANAEAEVPEREQWRCFAQRAVTALERIANALEVANEQ